MDVFHIRLAPSGALRRSVSSGFWPSSSAVGDQARNHMDCCWSQQMPIQRLVGSCQALNVKMNASIR